MARSTENRKKVRDRIKRIQWAIKQENSLRERRRKMGRLGGGPKTMAAAKTVSSGDIHVTGFDHDGSLGAKLRPQLKKGDMVWFKDPAGVVEILKKRATWGLVSFIDPQSNYCLVAHVVEGKIKEKEVEFATFPAKIGNVNNTNNLVRVWNDITTYPLNRFRADLSDKPILEDAKKLQEFVENTSLPEKKLRKEQLTSAYTETDERLVEL